jgi:hypothetical protein
MEEIDFKENQKPINQRLIFLLKSLKMSARTFSDAIGESPTNTQNYVGKRNAEPRASYLENVLRHFTTISPLWLLTGEGPEFISEAAESSVVHQSQSQNQKKNRGHIINHTGNGPTNYTLEACQRERDLLQLTCDQQQQQIQLLQANVEDLRRALTALSKP